MRQFDKPMGMAVQGDQLVLATRHEVQFLANARALAHDYLENQPGRYDALYLPQASYLTGDVNVHDVAFADSGILAVNTRFSCLARLSREFSFEPVWRPWFVTDLVPEDRCHLNGVALRDGKPKYVTTLGTTDTAGGWRDEKATGGVLIDVEQNEILVHGLSMPHSPRWHKGQLWVLNSGLGELWVVDPKTGQSISVCGLPGYLRGLCFVGPYAVIGMSRIREKHIFGGLPIQEQQRNLLCGVAVVDLRTGNCEGIFEFTSGCEELLRSSSCRVFIAQLFSIARKMQFFSQLRTLSLAFGCVLAQRFMMNHALPTVQTGRHKIPTCRVSPGRATR